MVDALCKEAKAQEGKETVEERHALLVVVCVIRDEQANTGLAEAAATLMDGKAMNDGVPLESACQ